MLDQPTIDRLAHRLDEAERSKSLIRAFTLEYPDLTIEDAYAIQRAWTKLQLARGRIVKGHKIGLTSKAMQSAVGISEPDYGVLFEDMFYPDASADSVRPVPRAAHRGRAGVRPEDRAEGAGLHASSTCSTPPTTSRRRWRSWKPGCIASIPRPRRRAR